MRRVQRQRPHDADGLLLEPGVRERRLHRRLAVHRQRHQRLAAAVPRPEQQCRRLEQRRLEPGLRRRPGRTGRSRSRARRTRRSPRPRRRARSRSSTSTRSGSSMSTSPTCSTTPRARPGPTARRPASRSRSSASSSPRPRTASSRSTTRSPHGKHLLFTPGVYDIDATIRVKRPGAIVLGLGMATLTAQNGVVPMTVEEEKGVVVSGLIFDAGPVNSPVLLQVGKPKQKAVAATRTTRPCSTTCSSASAARTSARRR